MKKWILVTASLLTAILACNLPGVPSTPLVSEQSPAPTPTSTPREPDLTHQPLYWFAPLPPLPVVAGRPFTGSDDFMQLFDENAPWQTTAGEIQVFKLYGEWVANHPGDELLRKAVQDIHRRGLALAIETGPLNPEDCGQGVEGFATVESGLVMAGAIKSVGGRLDFIALDEPYYFGHFYDGTNACHWSAEKIAREVDDFIQAVRSVFPDVIVGDTEPLAGPAGAPEYRGWLDTFHKVNGYHLAFLHMDIDWSRPSWPQEVKSIQQHGQQLGVPVGIIYNGNSFDPDDEAFLSAAGERVKKLEIDAGVRPDHVLFQSWNDKPDHVLPESEPYTFTGFIRQYFEDKSGLGYRREGKGANLALGKSARVSSQTGDTSGALAIDGDFGTLWNSGGGPVQWIEVDLGAEYSIAVIRLTTSQYPQGRTVHRLKIKGTDGSFELLHTFDGDTGDGDTLVFEPENPLTDIRYIRIETVTSPSWVAWREIEVIDAGE